ncbi:MAG: methionyl-tRNA formyltransferase [Patescibacteria group bacterium]|jgi:methionyl-tRNA formyltransferase
MKNYRIGFAGTGAFAIPILLALADVATVPFVFVKGKHGKSDSPLVDVAAQLNSTCIITEKSSELLPHCESATMNGLLVADYGLMIPGSVLALLPNNVLNVHPSLLPKYRGATPIPAAILAGDKESGVSLMVLDQAMDHGPIITQARYRMTGSEDAPELERTLSELGANLVRTHVLPYFENGKATEQDHSKATVTTTLARADGAIDLSSDVTNTIYRKILAYAPWPGCYASVLINERTRTIKFMAAKPCSESHNFSPGLYRKEKKLHLIASDGCLIVERLQVDSGRIVTADAFINGYRTALPILA